LMRAPDKPHRMVMNDPKVTTAGTRPSVRFKVLSQNNARSSAMRWSGLSVPESELHR
jgi:hypothetical protein